MSALVCKNKFRDHIQYMAHVIIKNIYTLFDHIFFILCCIKTFL